MDIQEAVSNFCRAMEHCDNIVQVHRAAGSGARGRRSSETSVNRGTVVLAVASWQAFVQDLALALLETAMADLQTAGPTGPLATPSLLGVRRSLSCIHPGVPVRDFLGVLL